MGFFFALMHFFTSVPRLGAAAAVSVQEGTCGPGNGPGERLGIGFLGWFSLLLLVAMAMPVRTYALSVIPPTFGELVAGSTQVVRVKVSKVSSRWDATPYGPVIRTYVECEMLRTLKGPAETTITLRFLGGKVGDESMTVVDMPTLEEGRSYILFVAENGLAMCPLVGVTHGAYPLVLDETTQVQYVARNNFQRLRAVDDVQVPIVTQAGHPALRAYAGPGMTRDEFEDAILRETAREGK